MYENNYKNPNDTGIVELEHFLNLIADLNEEIELFAMGGTAMLLKNIKQATKDIDFMTTANYEQIKRMFELAGLEEKSTSQVCNQWYMGEIRIDIFYNEFIIGIQLPDDWKELSEQIRTIDKLKLNILNWYDVIITKIARSENRDIEDILAIIKKQDINLKKLEDRYYGIVETALIKDYDYHFKHFKRCLNK